MSAQGQLFDNQHGVEGETEIGKGQITRYSNGQPTRFTFKKRFSGAPNVQITPILNNRHGVSHPFYLYLLNSTGGPPADEEGFYLGIWSHQGNTIGFEYYATSIGDEKKS